MTAPLEILFTTGSSFHTGSFSGTISGDPNTQASNPGGTVVVAADALVFDNQNFLVYGSDIAASNGTYRISTLPDDVYYPVGVMDSNGDGEIDTTYDNDIDYDFFNVSTGTWNGNTLLSETNEE